MPATTMVVTTGRTNFSFLLGGAMMLHLEFTLAEDFAEAKVSSAAVLSGLAKPPAICPAKAACSAANSASHFSIS